VGRLDLNSEGLLLLTNDGALTRALELPSSGWSRIYRARAYGEASQEKLDRLKDGITVEGIKYGPIDAKLDKASGRNVWITVTLAEGKNREVRRVLEALGLKVNRLIRLAYGPFSLGPLAPGPWSPGLGSLGPVSISPGWDPSHTLGLHQALPLLSSRI
jgi:23S rRNA pseudouridine2605 synthase